MPKTAIEFKQGLPSNSHNRGNFFLSSHPKIPTNVCKEQSCHPKIMESYHLVLFHLSHFIAFNDVALFDVVEVFDAYAAVVARLHFAGVVFETFEGGEFS